MDDNFLIQADARDLLYFDATSRSTPSSTSAPTTGICRPSSGDSYDRSQVLPGSGIIVPMAHRETPFDPTPEEWTATHELLVRAKGAVDERWSPDGYTLIWNCYPTGGQEVAHVHLHVIPRFADEPYGGRGGRWHIKQPENRRPDPSRKGRGFAVEGRDGP